MLFYHIHSSKFCKKIIIDEKEEKQTNKDKFEMIDKREINWTIYIYLYDLIEKAIWEDWKSLFNFGQT